MRNIEPVRCWDSNSNTAELLELYHQLQKSYDKDFGDKKSVTQETFEEKRGLLIYGVQKSRVSFTLFNNGLLDATFCEDELDKVEEEE
jgi:hypothetical protein